MSKEVVSYMLSGMDNMKSLQVQLILQCAPFLKGIKIACILNITEENSRELYSAGHPAGRLPHSGRDRLRQRHRSHLHGRRGPDQGR